MAKHIHFKQGFTLIEVMVSVIIITLVVMALYTMSANSTHIYTKTTQGLTTNQYLSFLIGNTKYGFEKETTDLEKLLDDFELEDELRRELKNKKVEILYTEVKSFDMSKFDVGDIEEETDTQEYQRKDAGQSQVIFELGKTSLLLEKNSGFLLRLRVL